MGNLVSISSTLIGADQPATIRAPEIEAGVGCDFDSYLLVPDNGLDDRIDAAKARLGRDVVILGHHYQRDEVVKFADFRGDSLKLSFQASPGRGPLHRLLRRSLHGRKRGHSSPRAPGGGPARPERRLLHGRYGRHRPGGSLLERTLFSPRFALDHPRYLH